MVTKWHGAALLMGSLLSACGGGGGDSQPSAITASPIQGVYEGSVSNQRQHNTLIMENNEFYTMYGNTISNVFYVMGFIHGNGQASNGSFTSTDLRDFFANGSTSTGTLSATYREGISFNGSITSASTTVTFTGTPIQNSLYNNNTAANLANIVGAWSLRDLQGNPVLMSIASNGTFSGSSNGCNFNGTITPRSSGKNVFNIALTFGAAPCVLPGQSATGIALEYMLASGKRQFLLAGTNSGRTTGAALIGSR